MDDSLEALVSRAQAGDGAALERVVREIQTDVFQLAMRMLGHADDARDASQEALVRVVTKLASFRGESRFKTWVFRVAANALQNYRTETRRPEISFEQAGANLDAANAMDAPSDPADVALVNEVKVVCTHGMLLCLDRPHRLAYILGEILDLQSDDAAAVLEITPAAFRKRLSRARDEMEAFLRSRCGLARPANKCRCATLVPAATSMGLVDPARLMSKTLRAREADRLRVDVEKARTAAEIFRSLPGYESPVDVAARLKEILETTN